MFYPAHVMSQSDILSLKSIFVMKISQSEKNPANASYNDSNYFQCKDTNI